MPQHADAQRVDQRVAQVGLVEDGLAADVGQAEAVAVATDAGHDPGQHAVGVISVQRPEAQRVHDGHGPRAHREDVADDAADPGRGSLVGLDVRRVVVALDLEGHGVALADVEDAGVLADPGEHLADGGLLGELAELLEVHLGGLVGAVLAPHHAVHRQLAADGRRPRISRIRAYSSALSPSSAQGCSRPGSLAAAATVSRSGTAAIYLRTSGRLRRSLGPPVSHDSRDGCPQGITHL